MKRKILYVIGYPHRMAGSQKQLAQLILNLPSQYDKAVLVTQRGGVSDYFSKQKNIETHILSPSVSLNLYGKKLLEKSLLSKASIFFKDYLKYTSELVKFFRKNKYDIIHCNDARAVLLVGLASLFSDTRLISHIQGERPIKRNLLWYVFELLPRKIIANADFVKSTLSRRVWSKTEVVYTGLGNIPSIEEHTSRWLLKQSKDRVLISCFASVVPFKGYHHLIEAIKILKDDKQHIGEDFLFLFIGDLVKEYRYYFDWLLVKIDEYGIGEHVMFTGWQDNPYTYYGLSDFTVLPSFKEEKLVINDKELFISGNEGFPTTHLEAMQFGLPIIGTRIAGVPEQIKHNFNGKLVEPKNPVALKDALKELIISNDLRTAYGKNSLKIASEKFSLNVFVKRVCEIYEEVLNF